jgi:hypothetical protein
MPYKDPEKTRQANKEWKKRNPDKVKEQWRRRNKSEAGKRANQKWTNTHKDQIREARLKRQAARESAGVCKICGHHAVIEGRKYCGPCQKKCRDYYWNSPKREQKQARDKEQYRARVETGICVDCRAGPSENGKTRCSECAAKQAERTRKFLALPHNKHKPRMWHLRMKYGITPEQWDALFASQGKACAVCLSSSERTWHTDHNHNTNKVRGILCGKCNAALGMLQDDPAIIERALSYVIQHMEVDLAACR